MLKTFSEPWLNFLRTVFPTPSILVTGLNIDWSEGAYFHKTILADSAFTFSNIREGVSVTLVLRNSSGLDVDVSFPAGIYHTDDLDLVVEPSKENIYSFFQADGKTYVTFVSKMINT